LKFTFVLDVQEPQPLPDQIDEAISHIKSLEEKLKKAKEKKEGLTSSRKRSYTCTYDPIPIATPKPPQLKIQELGSALEIVLTSGPDNQFLFYEIIRILHEEAVEVVSANFQVVGDSIFQVLHAQVMIIYTLINHADSFLIYPQHVLLNNSMINLNFFCADEGI
jgi:hypothetical protein